MKKFYFIFALKYEETFSLTQYFEKFLTSSIRLRNKK